MLFYLFFVLLINVENIKSLLLVSLLILSRYAWLVTVGHMCVFFFFFLVLFLGRLDLRTLLFKARFVQF